MSKLTVLLVDDHEGFINAAMRHFRRIEWLEVIGSAANGLQAIERSEALRPRVVLMDLAMPEMGGLQATRLIKTQDDAPYIVIASHFDDSEHREHAGSRRTDPVPAGVHGLHPALGQRRAGHRHQPPPQQ